MISKPNVNSNGCTVWLTECEPTDGEPTDQFFHREDGPAVIHTNGLSFWWYDGKYIDCKTQEEFERILKLKAFW